MELFTRTTRNVTLTVNAASGTNAIAHAVESFVCTRRNARSQELSLEAWRLLEGSFDQALTDLSNSGNP